MRCLVCWCAPTRELAAVDDNVKAYAKNVKVRTALIFGGVSQHKQVAQPKRCRCVGGHWSFAGPVQSGIVVLEWIEFLVLDEADTMLDMGFIHDIKRVIAMLPGDKVCFSARPCQTAL